MHGFIWDQPFICPPQGADAFGFDGTGILIKAVCGLLRAFLGVVPGCAEWNCPDHSTFVSQSSLLI
jgi:hypothetical protein